MDSTLNMPPIADDVRIPDDIARIAVLPSGYIDPEAMHEAFRWLRLNQPLGVASVEGYDPIWLVTKHADISGIERQPEVFRSMDANPILNTQAGDEFLRAATGGTTKVIASLTHMDAPEHGIYRRIAADYFLPNRMLALQAQIRDLAKQAVADLLNGSGEIDFVQEFALRYPLRVIMSIFGVPLEEEERMLRLTQDLFGANDPESKRSDVEISPDMAARQFQQTLEEFYGYFSAYTLDRRKNPRDDLMTIIANAKVDGEWISDFNANGYYVTIATAGHDTTSSTVSAVMKALAADPALLAQVKGDPSLIPGMIDEGLRWTSPVLHFMRSATQDVEIRGRQIRKGDRLMLCYPSANRDEDVFKDPFNFDVTRKPNRHLAFGSGPHMCLGQHLAKMELRILFEELLPHVASVAVVGKARYVETNFVSGLKSLPVKMTFV